MGKCPYATSSPVGTIFNIFQRVMISQVYTTVYNWTNKCTWMSMWFLKILHNIIFPKPLAYLQHRNFFTLKENEKKNTKYNKSCITSKNSVLFCMCVYISTLLVPVKGNLVEIHERTEKGSAYKIVWYKCILNFLLEMSFRWSSVLRT